MAITFPTLEHKWIKLYNSSEEQQQDYEAGNYTECCYWIIKDPNANKSNELTYQYSIRTTNNDNEKLGHYYSVEETDNWAGLEIIWGYFGWESIDYEYSGEDFSYIVNIPSLLCSEEKVINIIYPETTIDLNGLYGTQRRFAKAVKELKYRDAHLDMKERFSKMGSLSESVTYNPDNIDEIVSEFLNSLSRMPDILKEQGLNDENKDWFLKRINWKNNIK